MTATLRSSDRVTATPLVDGRSARRVTLFTTGLLALAAAAGVAVPDLYRETAAVEAMFRAYDLVILVVAAPLLLLTSVRSKTSTVGLLTRAGALGFTVYLYGYYVFGMAFNAVFLVHVFAFTGSMIALGLTITTLAPRAAGWAGGRARTASVMLLLLGVSLGAMWIGRSLAFALGGPVPADGSLLIGSPNLTHLGYAMDLAVLVPAYTLAGIGVLLRRVWGYLLAGIALVAGAITQLTYMAALASQAWSDIPGATAFDPYEPFILAVYLVGMVSLYRAIASSERHTPPVTAGRLEK